VGLTLASSRIELSGDGADIGRFFGGVAVTEVWEDKRKDGIEQLNSVLCTLEDSVT
jgi:hypothetical protein